MISKLVQKSVARYPDEGPTLHALTHGHVEVRVQQRGPIHARRVGLHTRLHARGKLTDAEWVWAARYVDEYEIAAGGRPGRPDSEPADPYRGPLIYNRQCAAAAFLARADARITWAERRVLIAACVECAVVVDLGPMLGLWRKQGEADDRYEDRIKNRVVAECVRIIRQACGAAKK